MKNIGDIDPGLLARRTLRVGSMLVLFLPAALSAQQYQRTDLVSDTIVEGTNPNDSQLKNPWGITRGTNSDWWVSDEMAGVSTLYNGIGTKNGLVVTIPHSAQTTIGSPTGIVVNGSKDFEVAPGAPAAFIFASFDGTISGWNPGVNLTNAIPKVPGSNESILTGRDHSAG
jgi:hypothetical protein